MKVTVARVYITEGDHIQKTILEYLHDDLKIRGVTCFRGISGFGSSGKMHSSDLLDLSLNLPIVIEFFDEDAVVQQALAKLGELIPPGHVITFAADLN
jgi:PII-like signaling protein